MRILLSALLGLGVFCGGCAQAAGVYGPSGLFLHTTAYLPAGRAPTLGATAFTQLRRTPAGDRSITWVPIFADGRVGARGEVGALYLYQEFQGRSLSSYGGFVKYQLLAEQARRPAVAADLEIISGDLRQQAITLVASKEFSRNPARPLRLHLGWTVHRRSDLVGPGGRFSETDTAPFAGVELGLAPHLRLIAEGETKLKFYPAAATALGVMWTPCARFGLAIGWLNTGRSEQMRPFIGVGYRVRSVD